MSIERKFRPGAGIWFVVHMESNGDIRGYEYHDWREGGFLPGNHSSDYWQEAFLADVRRSYADKEEAVEEAVQFLADMRKEIAAS